MLFRSFITATPVMGDILAGGFVTMTGVAVMNPAAGETSEFAQCVLNISEISGLAYQEVVGRGGETSGEY